MAIPVTQRELEAVLASLAVRSGQVINWGASSGRGEGRGQGGGHSGCSEGACQVQGSPATVGGERVPYGGDCCHSH